MVRRPPAVELLPLWGRRPRRGRRLLSVGPGGFSSPDAAGSFLHLAQGLAGRHGDGRGPALAAVEAEVVFGHGPAPEREGSRGRSEGVSVMVVAAAIRLPGTPATLLRGLMVLTEALRRSGLTSPARVVPVMGRLQKNTLFARN